MSAREQIRDRLREAGLEGWLYAANLRDQTAVELTPDEPVAMASLYKLPLLIAFARRWADGGLDPAECRTVRPAEVTPGPTGLTTLVDPVTTSLRNLAVLMATLSDNAAADLVLDAVGLDAVNDVLRAAGLQTTKVRASQADANAALMRQTRVRSLPRAFERLSSNDELFGDRVYDPQLTSPTAARDMVRLLEQLWGGRLIDGEQLRFVQSTMRQQVWPHRLRAGFPYRSVSVAGKTGTLGALRHEVGVIEFPNEPPYAVAVLTRAARADAVLPIADRTIGEVARIAVWDLRSQL